MKVIKTASQLILLIAASFSLAACTGGQQDEGAMQEGSGTEMQGQTGTDTGTTGDTMSGTSGSAGEAAGDTMSESPEAAPSPTPGAQ